MLVGAVLGAMLLSAKSAWADAIDGNWCASDGRHMTIHGAKITTPAGTRARGDYSRHAFSYVVPASDPGAGSSVSMILVDENTVHLTMNATSTSSAQAEVQIWRRCDLTT
ncbi:MAG: hypothetical protein QNJ94_00935 [Alphaproteobacteria bacterium]|nr:hypothetical protein [Alphaproteobacteria bacterium]